LATGKQEYRNESRSCGRLYPRVLRKNLNISKDIPKGEKRSGKTGEPRSENRIEASRYNNKRRVE